MKLPEGWMFSKVKITDNANSLLNLVETKFYEVGLALPCLFWFLQTLIPRIIPRAISQSPPKKPRRLTEILPFWATLTHLRIVLGQSKGISFTMIHLPDLIFCMLRACAMIHRRQPFRCQTQRGMMSRNSKISPTEIAPARSTAKNEVNLSFRNDLHGFRLD